MAEPKLRPSGSAKCRHLQFGRLAVDGLARIFDLPLERLPGFANNLFVCGDDALGRAAERMRLDAHIGRELSLALGIAVEPDRTVEILVAGIVGRLRGRVPSF